MKRRIAIIGGGLSGLTCAHAIERRGIEAVVFEASAAPGGRSVVEQIDGFTIDAGAQYLLGPELFRSTYDLIREIGLSADVVAIPPHTGQFYKGRIYRHRVSSAAGLLKFKGLNFADKAMLPRMAYLLARFGSAVDFHHPERGVSLDDESVAAFVKRELSQNILNYVAGPLISTLFFYGSEETSKLLYLMLAKHMHNAQNYTLRGGIGRIAARLADGADVRTGIEAAVVARTDGGGYEVVMNGADAGQSGQAKDLFSDVVVAVRGDSVLRIRGLSGLLSAADLRFFSDCRYGRAVTLVIATAAPLDGGCFGISIPRVEGLSASSVSFHDYIDSSRVPGGQGLTAITGGGPTVSGETLLEDIRRMYPAVLHQRVDIGDENFRRRVDARFTKTYEWASAMPKFPPGRYREIAAFQQRTRHPGLWFCGDYLLGPFVEAAIQTGLRVAAAIST